MGTNLRLWSFPPVTNHIIRQWPGTGRESGVQG